MMNTYKNGFLRFFFQIQILKFLPLGRFPGASKMTASIFFHSFVTVVVEIKFLMLIFFEKVGWFCIIWDIYAKYRKDCLQPILSLTLNHTHVLQLGRNPNHIHIQIGKVCLVDNQQNRAFHLMAISKIHRHIINNIIYIF